MCLIEVVLDELTAEERERVASACQRKMDEIKKQGMDGDLKLYAKLYDVTLRVSKRRIKS